jgi:tetraacyldisaccharide 4'-kinase
LGAVSRHYFTFLCLTLNLLKFIGFPFAAVYGFITALRNALYDKGVLKSTEFDVPTICVGNLAVGGSGKTPMVEYLIRILSQQYTIAVLSRGYGRKSVGFQWVTTVSTAKEVGDEPLQIKKHFPDVSVAVCEKRVDGVIQIMADQPQTNLIILDDALQHRALKPRISLLLSDYNRPWFKDYLMPVGRLRESRKGYKRADAIVYTKCPKEYTPFKQKEIPQFYTRTGYNPLKLEQPVFGFSGLANNTYFKSFLENNYTLAGFKGYADHYNYTQKDIEYLTAQSKGAQLICTAKDKVKMDALAHNLDILVQEIQLENTSDFQDWLIHQLQKNES